MKNERNIKNIWDIINSVIKSKHKDNTVNIVDENAIPVTKEGIPNEFIDYFTYIAYELSSKLPTPERTASYCLSDRFENAFFFMPTNVDEICKSITDLKSSGRGIYKVSTIVLEYSKNMLAPILTRLINACVNQGYFPTTDPFVLFHHPVKFLRD